MFMLDASAWSRFLHPALPDDRLTWVAEHVEHRGFATCLPFLLEAGFSARSAADYGVIASRLEQFPRVAITDEIENAALSSQRELALRGHHRLAVNDLTIAACAHVTGAGVLHYDHDYDLIRTHTTLRFDSEWLMPPGTL
jgi:predicted nucleic acid-binding protein